MLAVTENVVVACSVGFVDDVAESDVAGAAAVAGTTAVYAEGGGGGGEGQDGAEDWGGEMHLDLFGRREFERVRLFR